MKTLSEIFSICNRMGRIPNFNQFDGNFFGIMGQMVENIDPQARLLLETTYEAIIDAGISVVLEIFCRYVVILKNIV